MTREHISFTFNQSDMLLFLCIGFSFVRPVVACAILERTSGVEPSSETNILAYFGSYWKGKCPPFYSRINMVSSGKLDPLEEKIQQRHRGSDTSGQLM